MATKPTRLKTRPAETTSPGLTTTATAEVTITGTSPLLMRAFPMVPLEAQDKRTPEEQAAYGDLVARFARRGILDRERLLAGGNRWRVGRALHRL
jgi:hypothetical protein